jgi:hypothetical protein
MSGELGDDLAELEDEPEAVAAQGAALGLAHRVDLATVEVDFADPGTRIPARQCSSVDLPDPLGPMTARISPEATDTLAPRAGSGRMTDTGRIR